MNPHYIIRESQFTLSPRAVRRKIGINPKAVRVDITLAEGGPLRVGCTDGTQVVWHADIAALHEVYSLDLTGPAARYLLLTAIDGAPARGTVLIWGLAQTPSRQRTL